MTDETRGFVTHVYKVTGRVSAWVDITWTAEYRVGSGPWQPVDGTVTRTSPRVDLRVLEAEPHLVAP